MAETKSTKVAAPAAAPAPSHPGGNGLAIGAMITGIVAFIFGWTAFFGLIVGIVAIILGVIALKKNPAAKGFSIAGIATGAVGAVVSLIVTIITIIALVSLGTAGGVLHEASKQLENYTAENKALIEAKKDFAKGSTGEFAHFKVKVNSVQRNYQPDDSYLGAKEGNEFIVVNLTVTNVDDENQSISSYDFKINEDGVASAASYFDVNPAFEGGDLSPKASVTGNIMFEVTKGSNKLKLQYETYAYDSAGSGVKNLVYTLAL